MSGHENVYVTHQFQFQNRHNGMTKFILPFRKYNMYYSKVSFAFTVTGPGFQFRCV